MQCVQACQDPHQSKAVKILRILAGTVCATVCALIWLGIAWFCIRAYLLESRSPDGTVSGDGFGRPYETGFFSHLIHGHRSIGYFREMLDGLILLAVGYIAYGLFLLAHSLFTNEKNYE